MPWPGGTRHSGDPAGGLGIVVGEQGVVNVP